MSDRVDVGNLRVARVLYDFITNEALPGTGVDADAFWAGVDKVVTDLAPRNRELLERRDDLQTQVDRWHRQRAIEPLDGAAYQDFLTEIGYLVPEPEDFTITTANVDDEITTTAGPQLVVPILNARFALNAANARWGSLYDALYGTDVIPEADGAEKASADTGGYNKVRGDKVIAYAREVLDGAAPLASGSWKDAVGLKIDDGQLLVELGDEFSTGLQNPDQFVGYTGKLGKPQWSVLLINHGLHIEVLIDPDSPSVPPTRPASRMWCWSRRSPRSWTSRTLSRPWTPRTRCSGTETGWASTRATCPKRCPRAARRSPACSTRTVSSPPPTARAS